MVYLYFNFVIKKPWITPDECYLFNDLVRWLKVIKRDQIIIKKNKLMKTDIEEEVSAGEGVEEPEENEDTNLGQ